MSLQIIPPSWFRKGKVIKKNDGNPIIVFPSGWTFESDIDIEGLINLKNYKNTIVKIVDKP